MHMTARNLKLMYNSWHLKMFTFHILDSKTTNLHFFEAQPSTMMIGYSSHTLFVKMAGSI